jgi:hypothetical protein
MVGMADLMERQSPKLLAQAGQVLNQIVSEALCDHNGWLQRLTSRGIS